jgi:hypothetical protein
MSLARSPRTDRLKTGVFSLSLGEEKEAMLFCEFILLGFALCFAITQMKNGQRKQNLFRKECTEKYKKPPLLLSGL